MEHRDRRKSDNASINSDLLQGFLLGDIVILPNDSEVIFHGQRRHLPPKALEILLFMCSNQNQLLSTQRLLKFGWGDAENKRRSLTHVISELRHALDDHKECPEFIQTINRKGYRLIAKVKKLDDKVLYPNIWQNKGNSSLQTAQLAENKWHLSFALLKNSKLFRVSAAFSIITWLILQIIALVFPIFNVPDWGLKLVVLMLVVGFPLVLLFTWLNEIKLKKNLFKIQKDSPRKKKFYKQLAVDFVFIGVLSTIVGFLSLHLIETIEQEQATSESVSASKKTVISIPVQDNLLAVTPFQFDDDAFLPEYFKSTFQGEIISALSKQKHFNLVSQRAVNEVLLSSTLSEYAEKLGARYLLDGKVVGQENEFAVIINISDTKTSLQVWSSILKGNPDNLLFVQKELYRQVFNALALIAKTKENDTQFVINTDDFHAYDEYIQGKSELAKIPSKESRDAAEILFLNALNYDANFTLASAGLCQTYLDQYELSKVTSTFQSAKRICQMLTQVPELKEEGYVALGNLNRISGEYLQSVTYYESALNINDKNLAAIIGIAQSKNSLGEKVQAEKLFAQAVQIEPAYWKNYQSFGDFLFSNGQYAEASEQYAKVTLLKPNYELGYSNLGASYYLDDKLKEASEAWQHSLSLNPNALTYSNLGTAYFFRHQFDNATENYQMATKLQPADAVLWGNLGDAEKFSGKVKDSLIAYEKALELANEQLLVNPKDSTTQAMIARYQSELGQCDRAMSRSQNLQTLNSTDPYLFYDIAIAAINCKQEDTANALLQKALTLGYSKKLLNRDIQFSSIYQPQ